MAGSHIRFLHPPVVETILNLQFQPIQGFTSAHIGIFWKDLLSTRLPGWGDAKIIEQVRIDDIFEDFGPPVFRFPSIKLGQVTPKLRMQIVHRNEDRMLQIQDSRIIYNWRKKKEDYPTYEKIKPEFDQILACFNEFLATNFSPLRGNQWEISYISHIPKDTLWNDVSDWSDIFPGIYIAPCQSPVDSRLETLNGGWRWVLGGDKGRLHALLQHGRVYEPEEKEVILLQLVARGPIDPERTMEDGFSLGHDTIVSTFQKMTSKLARDTWEEIR